jgi:phage tail tube protein FII
MAAPMTLFVMESANLIVTDAVVNPSAPGITTHLSLQEVKLPGLEENYVDHIPGGAPVAMEVSMHINRLESTFNLAGWQPEIAVVLGKSDRIAQRFTCYGLIRDRRSGAPLQAKAVMEGRLGRVNPTAFRKGDLMHHEYSIRGITHYELYMGIPPTGDESIIYWWDFFTSDFIIGDRNMNQDLVNILAIPGIAL